MENLFNLPKISFIVITHNFEEYIQDCLNSIKNQSYKNFELIVVDDASLDKTPEVVENFINNNTLDIKFIKNTENLGQLASFLNGLVYATGEFVAQIDGDDVLFEDYALCHVETHLKTSVALTSCQHVDIDENNTLHSFESVDCPQKRGQGFNLSAVGAEDIKNNVFTPYKTDEGLDVKVLSNDKYNFATWHWSPASSGVMRKSVCDLLLNIKHPEKIKITADKFIFSFMHLIGSSAIIYKPLYAYRRHKSNYSLANPVMGSFRYLKTQTQKNYIKNNKLIRQTMLKFILSNYDCFVEKFNKANVRLIIKKIIFSFDFSTLKSAIKSLFI